MFGNTFQILLAGEDTTAHSLTRMAWFIGRERAPQRRFAEGRARDRGPDSTFEYGDAVLRETMRLRSVARLFFVERLEDVTIAGVELSCTRLTALTRYAGAHGDAAFDPERRRDQEGFLTFGACPRFCPGRKLLPARGPLALAMLTRGFEPALDPKAPPVRERVGFTMQPTGLRVLVRSLGRPRGRCS